MTATATAPATSNNGKALAMPSAVVGDRGIVLQSFDDLARFAKMVEGSGMAPKGMNAAAIGVAIQMGFEVGMSPMQALQSTAVIHGRPAIYGDAAKALVEASGLMEDYDQWYEVDGKKLTTGEGHARTPTPSELKNDTLICCVMSKRRGRAAMVSTFSVGDAKTATLWGKAGNWQTFPARMLMWRARGFNLRDNFGDVLKGLRTAEEAFDEPVEATAAPRVTPLHERLASRAASLPTGPIPDAELVEPVKEAAPVDVAEPDPEPTHAEQMSAADASDAAMMAEWGRQDAAKQ